MLAHVHTCMRVQLTNVHTKDRQTTDVGSLPCLVCYRMAQRASRTFLKVVHREPVFRLPPERPVVSECSGLWCSERGATKLVLYQGCYMHVLDIPVHVCVLDGLLLCVHVCACAWDCARYGG